MWSFVNYVLWNWTGGERTSLLIRLWSSHQWLVLIKFSADDKGDIKEIKDDRKKALIKVLLRTGEECLLRKLR